MLNSALVPVRPETLRQTRPRRCGKAICMEASAAACLRLCHTDGFSSAVQAGLQVLHLFSSSLSKPQKPSCAADDDGLQLLIGPTSHTHTRAHWPVPMHIDKHIQSTIWWLFPTRKF